MSATHFRVELDSWEHLPDDDAERLGLEAGKWGSFFLHVPQRKRSHFTCLTSDLTWFDMFTSAPRDVLEDMDFPWQEKCERLFKGWPDDDYFEAI